jgi:hypothetical protein
VPPTPAASPNPSESRTNVDSTHRSVSELEADFKLALTDYLVGESLSRQGAIAPELRAKARGRFLLTSAILEGLRDELDEQDERYKLQLQKKQFEVAEAEGQSEASQAAVTRNQRLNTRLPGTASTEDVAKAEGEFKAANARVLIKRVELQEVELRRAQGKRRAMHIKQLLQPAERLKASGNAPPAAPSDGPAVR